MLGRLAVGLWLGVAAVCAGGLEQLRRQTTGVVVLPPGTLEIHDVLSIPAGAHDLEIRGHPSGTLLRAAPGFRARAILSLRHASRVRLSGFAIEGNRSALEGRRPVPPHDAIVATCYDGHGILLEDVREVSLSNLNFREIAGFAVAAVRSADVRLEGVTVEDSGTLGPSGRNNTTGGVLFSEGTLGFAVRSSRFRRIRGNAVWTHSVYMAPRNRDGRIEENWFEEIGRDAIQVGHASQVRVAGNRGRRIGFPFEVVDAEGGGTPVAIDTAGEVDLSLYAGNRFEEVNGKCIDLDGFHHGEVAGNSCVNGGRAEDYPHGHFGIVVNNWNPDMRSEAILIRDNLIDGFKFGGLFLIGRGHTVAGNRFLRLNRAGCNESAARFGCVAIAGEPDVLQAGIYLGRLAAEWAGRRADPSREHLIRDNVITGHRMSERCILAAPGVSLEASLIENNRCEDAP
jgi:hypothetical protein